MAPRVLVDASAVPADRGGVGRYVDGLLAALCGASADVSVVCQRSDAERYRRLLPSVEVHAGPAAIAHRPARLAWEQTGLPLLAENLDVDVVHSPYYTMPMHSPVPVAVTIHDVTWITEPQLHGTARAGGYRAAIRTALRCAARILVPSESTRAELVDALGADPAGIAVAHHGVDMHAFHPPDPDERRRASDRLGLHGAPYVAFLGDLERRKNVPALVRGWVRAVQGLEAPPALVLAGSVGWDDEVDAAVIDVPAQLHVIRPGFLRPGDLPGLLGGATVVACASETEGFGFPVLEAMACGAPVLAARRRSLPEIGADAIAYTEPDEAAIAAALGELLADGARRSELAGAGRERARQFSWEASAQLHLSAYAAAAGVAD